MAVVINGLTGITTNPGTLLSGSTIGVGGATPSASGAGISFPATQSPSTDVNTLDDYEEGTFTPTIIGSTGDGVGTYSEQLGSYTKIGRLVYCQVAIGWTAHTGTGNLQIANLPFSATSYNVNGWSHGFFSYIDKLALTANNYFSGVEVISSNAKAAFYQTPVGGGSAAGVPMDTAATIEGMIIYQTT